MKFREALTLLLFCSAAGFTVADIGLDFSLVYQYANKINDPENDEELVRFLWLFLLLTASFIMSGGLFQTAMVIKFAIKKDPRLSTMPIPGESHD
jgi:hypothetical protein